MPSFVLNLYLLKNWTHSTVAFILEFCLLTILNQSFHFEFILASITYVIIIANFDKEKRDLWHVYTSSKKSEGCYFDLFQNSPHPTFIVEAQGKIIFHNRSALGLLDYSRKNKLETAYDYFEDFFLDEDKQQSISLIQNSLYGNVCVDEFTIYDYYTLGPMLNLGLLVSAERIS